MPGRGFQTCAYSAGFNALDLLAARRIPDPFFGDNEKRVPLVGEASRVYHHAFDVAPGVLKHEYALLRCEGLDTPATIRVNGERVAKTDNMFRIYEFGVKTLLRPLTFTAGRSSRSSG